MTHSDQLLGILGILKNTKFGKENISAIDILKKKINQYSIYINTPSELNKFSPHYSKFAHYIFDSLKSTLDLSFYEEVIDGKTYKAPQQTGLTLQFIHIIQNLEKLEIFNIIKDEFNNIVLIGPNGSGKSSLANFLKGNNSDSICVIPAQKNLTINIDNNSFYKHYSTIKDIREYQAKQSTKHFDIYEHSTHFSNLIAALMNEDYQTLIDQDDGKKNIAPDESIYKKLIRIFSDLLPNISFQRNSATRLLQPIDKTGKPYELDSMSDGEKGLLFFISSTLMAPKKAFIIVDEPETYLNPSIYKRLWDLLIKEREDCQFIFITHSMDFVASRDSNATSFYWIKNFVPPESWDFEPIPDLDNIPKALTVEILGSKKPILFFEGKHDSEDYQVYSTLFGDDYTIIPANGHSTVINHTRAINDSSSLHLNQAISIIDGDHIPEEQIKKYAEDKIYVLPFNEIEMLLLEESIIYKVLEQECENDQEIENKLNVFKNEFEKLIRERIDYITASAMKKRVDLELSNYRIEFFKDVQEIQDGLRKITDNFSDLTQKSEEYKSLVLSALDMNDYPTMLKVCNLKGEVLNGLGNKLLGKDYSRRAKIVLNRHSDIQEEIKRKYFSQIN